MVPGARVDYVTAVPLVRKQRLSVSRRVPWLGEWVLGEAEVEEGLEAPSEARRRCAEGRLVPNAVPPAIVGKQTSPLSAERRRTQVQTVVDMLNLVTTGTVCAHSSWL